MEEGDIATCEELWQEAWEALRQAYAMGGSGPTGAERARLRRRIAHLRATDPGGSWVADDDGMITGLAQAFVRDGLWVLSLLAVAVSSQSRGVGRSLLERTLRYGDGDGPGLILSSRDPRAMHRYAAAGFALHPSVMAMGTVDHARLAGDPGVDVRPGAAGDLDHAAYLGRRLRGAPHGPDVEFLLGEGAQLFVAEGGFTVFGERGPVVLAATDERTAGALLHAGLGALPDGAAVGMLWVTGRQQWAIQAAIELGFELHPQGAVMVRGAPGPLSPYLPSGAFG